MESKATNEPKKKKVNASSSTRKQNEQGSNMKTSDEVSTIWSRPNHKRADLKCDGDDEVCEEEGAENHEGHAEEHRQIRVAAVHIVRAERRLQTRDTNQPKFGATQATTTTGRKPYLDGQIGHDSVPVFSGAHAV